MELILDIKGKKALYPHNGDVIVHNGKDYYVTTKDEILKEAKILLEDTQKELEKNKALLVEIKQEYDAYKKEIAAQMLQMSELIEKLYK